MSLAEDFAQLERAIDLKTKNTNLNQEIEDLKAAISALNCYCGPYEAGVTCDICELKQELGLKND